MTTMARRAKRDVRRLVSRETAELAATPMHSRESQCDGKIVHESRMLAENFACLLWLRSGGERCEAYACPWCSTSDRVNYHIGRPKGQTWPSG